MNVSEDGIKKKFRLIKGRDFRTTGTFKEIPSSKSITLSKMIFFNAGTELTATKVMINNFHPDMFEGTIVGSDFKIILSFTEVE